MKAVSRPRPSATWDRVLFRADLGDTVVSVPDHSSEASHMHFLVSQCVKELRLHSPVVC